MNQLLDWRMKKMYTQEEMAKMVNVSLSTWRNWEKERSKPILKYKRRIVELMGIKLNESY